MGYANAVSFVITSRIDRRITIIKIVIGEISIGFKKSIRRKM